MKTKQSPAQLGVCSWSLKAISAEDLVTKVRALELAKVQMALNAFSRGDPAWVNVGRLCGEAGIEIVSGMFHTAGEDYSSPAAIRRTGGFVPDATWQENRLIVPRIAEAAAALGVKQVSTHAGFIPPDPSDAAYPKLVARLREVADVLGASGLTLLFETGQETAATLLGFLDRLQRRNVGVNFDPANMILYDMGEPVAALRKLMPWVRQCHLKDAIKSTRPGEWGAEVVVGTGQVDWRGFLELLNEHGYAGPLVIEREGGADRMVDVRQGADFIRGLMGLP